MAAVLAHVHAPLAPPVEGWWERRAFRDLARDAMAAQLDTPLGPGPTSQAPSAFDLASRDGRIVGDAHALTPYNARKVVARAWLLSEAQAEVRFIVFGRDLRLAHAWMARHARHFPQVRFFFLAGASDLRPL